MYGAEGSKRFVDLAHSVIKLEKNSRKVVVDDDEIKCNRIISIQKCRDGDLERELAFQFGGESPTFIEIGEIERKVRRKDG